MVKVETNVVEETNLFCAECEEPINICTKCGDYFDTQEEIICDDKTNHYHKEEK